MKKVFSAILVFFTAFLLVGCKGLTNEVTFISKGETYHQITLKEGEEIDIPDDPLVFGYEFSGWYLGDEKYDFSKPITEDLELVAMFSKKINYDYDLSYDLSVPMMEQVNLLEEKGRKSLLGSDPFLTENLGLPTRANLWTYSAYMTMLASVYKVLPNEETKKLLDNGLEGLEWYKVTNRDDDHLLYASKKGLESPAYFDDNVWLVVAFIKNYQTTNDETYLNLAKGVMEWIYTGWVDDEIGGILWREFPVGSTALERTRNTCINGPAAWTSLQLYEITGEMKYLEWGIKLYQWTYRTLYDKTRKVFLDSIREDGTVDPMVWTYNQGTMLSSAAYLYKILGEDMYEKHVEDYIEGGLKTFQRRVLDQVENGIYLRDNPWFRFYFLQGLLDAFRYVSNDFGIYLEKLKNAMIYGLENHLDDNGFLKYFWSEDEGEKLKPLYIEGNIEMIAILLEYNQEIEKLKEVTP